MDERGKYKPPEAIEQSQQEIEETATNPEEQKSLEVALEKLAIIEDPDFHDFAVRFVSSEEYQHILQEGRFFSQKEVYRPNIGNYDLVDEEVKNFQQWLEHWLKLANTYNKFEQRRHGWATVTDQLTDWGISTKIMREYEELLGQLRTAHTNTLANIQEQQRNISDVRSQTMANFRERLLEKYKYLFMEFSEPEGSVGQSRLKERFTEEQIQTIQNFLHSSDFLDSPENLRSLINAIAYEEEVKGPSWDRTEQYHLLLIFSQEALSSRANQYRREWGHLRNETESEPHMLLGTVALVPNKELYQQIANLSSHAGEWAHPILDRHGIVRYPRQETAEEIEAEN
jgi:hypothetical protein